MNKANLNHDSVTSHNPQTFATGLGFMAILFWSTTIAFSRSLSEQIGTLTTAAAVYLLGGLLGCLSLVLRGKKLRDILALPHAYLGVCGALFAIYALCLYLAIGLAADRHQVMAVGVINYLWPGLTLAFSVPILKRRARAGLLPGIALAFAGVVLAMVPQGQFNLAAWAGDMARNIWSYLLATVAAICWGLYSNLARRLAGQSGGEAVPLFLMVTGIFLALLCLGFRETSRISVRVVAELAYMGLVPTFLAYNFWDLAMRQGDLTLVASSSYLTPLLSALASSLYLGVQPGWSFWVGCALVVAGAVLCKVSIVD